MFTPNELLTIVGACFIFVPVHIYLQIHTQWNKKFMETIFIVTICDSFGILKSITFH